MNKLMEKIFRYPIAIPDLEKKKRNEGKRVKSAHPVTINLNLYARPLCSAGNTVSHVFEFIIILGNLFSSSLARKRFVERRGGRTAVHGVGVWTTVKLILMMQQSSSIPYYTFLGIVFLLSPP